MSNVLITSTSRGIGKALKEIFIKRGDIVIGYKRSELGDIRDVSTIEKLINLSQEKNLNILVNCAGVYSPHGIATESIEKAKEIMDVNLVAPILLTISLWDILKKNQGVIININSIAGRKPFGKEAAYRASKFGLTGFSGVIYYDGLDDNIRIIDIPLGGVNTDMLNGRACNWKPYQSPESAAQLIIEVLNSKAPHININHRLIVDKIIDNGVNNGRT